ncbi:hypothetical protein AA313_de0207601 [Arthrobotrys entomopaga]|nr:hypothetical protein AA313_de0207601 [Arthrobotrys entomopaga]
MPPQRRAAAKAAAAKAWLNNKKSNPPEESSTKMPARATRSSKPTTEPAVEPVEAPKPKRSTQKTKAIEPASSSEKVEVTLEEAPAPPPRRTRGRAASTASVEEAPAASKPSRSTRKIKTKEVTETVHPIDTVEVVPEEKPAPPARKTRGRAASTASVEEAPVASKPTRSTRRTKAKEEVTETQPPVDTVRVAAEEKPAPVRRTRGRAASTASVEEAPTVSKPTRQTRKTKTKAPEQPVETESAQEEAPAAGRSSRATRKRKASEPVPSIDTVEAVEIVETIPEEAPAPPAKRTRGRTTVTASVEEPLVVSKVGTRSTRATKAIETPQNENDAPPVEEKITRTRGKKTTKAGTAKPKQKAAPTRSTRSKRSIKEVGDAEGEESPVEERNAKRVKTDLPSKPVLEVTEEPIEPESVMKDAPESGLETAEDIVEPEAAAINESEPILETAEEPIEPEVVVEDAPEPVLETADGLDKPEVAMNDASESVLETIEQPIGFEVAVNDASEIVSKMVEEPVEPEVAVNDTPESVLKTIEEPIEAEEVLGDIPEPIVLFESSEPQAVSELPPDKLYGTTDEDEPLLFEDAQESIDTSNAEPEIASISMATTVQISFSETVVATEGEMPENEGIMNFAHEEEEEEAYMDAPQELSDVEMLEVDSSFLVQQEFNQTPEKRSFPGPLVEENTSNPSALAPLSPAAVNASPAGPTENPFSNPFAKPDDKIDNAPPQTPIRNDMFSMAPTSTGRGYSFSHLSYVPRNPSPLRQAPLRAMYSPSEATPTPPRRRRPVIENGILSGPGDPSPLRPEEMSNTDLDYQEKTPTKVSRRLNSPVPRGRSRSRSIRRESSPLKNAVEFSAQESNESETPRKQETPKKIAPMSPFHRLVAGGYDPNQEISELREEEVPMTPASDTSMGNFLEDYGMLESKNDLDGTILNQESPFVGIIGGVNVTGTGLLSHVSNEYGKTIEKALATLPDENSDDIERVPETPPQQDESDIPMSSPMATPMPTRSIILSQEKQQQLESVEQKDQTTIKSDPKPLPPNVRRSKRLFEPKKGKPEGRHSTGSLARAQEKTQEHTRRSTLSGSIDVSAGPSRDIKHPRASEARSAYLGPPPTMTVEAYQEQFKSSVLGAPSGLCETDSPVIRAETMSPVIMEEMEQVVEAAAVTNKGQMKSVSRRFGGDGADDSSDILSTDEKDIEMATAEEQVAQSTSLTCGSDESSLSDVPSDMLSSDVSNDDSESSGIQSTQQLDSNGSNSLASEAETSSRTLTSETGETSEASKAERKSRIPLLKPGKEAGNSSPFSARLHRLSHTRSLTERELSKVTARNTTRNGVYKQSKFDRKVIRLPGPRPPSPNRETQSAAAEESRNKRKRVFEETGIALGPGDDTNYIPPEISPSTKRVKWHNELEHEFDEEEKPRFNTRRGILAPERVREDPRIVQEVTIQKFLYEGERDIFDEDYYDEAEQ